MIDYIMNDFPNTVENLTKFKSVSHYEVRKTSPPKPDKKMTVVGRNMLNDTIKQLTEQIAALETRIATLENP